MQFRRLLLVMIIFMIFTAAAGAQPRMGDRAGREEEQLKRMKEKIGLTDDQVEKVKAIMKKVREEAQADFENGDGDRQARREAMMKRIEKSDNEIMKLLTKEQKKQYEELKKERRKEMEQRRRDRE